MGYNSATTFRRPLQSFLGMAPSQYRRQAPRRLERAGPLPPGADTDQYWERVLDGELSEDEARALDAYLERLAPGGAGGPATDDADDPWTRCRRTLAEGFAHTVETLPFAEQRRLVRDAVWFPDATLFELLSERSREASDTDPDRGVELALLAIDSLTANGLLERDSNRAALAWARLALARWRTGDLEGAEQDLERSASDDELTHDDDWVKRWDAERGRVEAAFHWHRGRWREALELAESSVAHHRETRPGDLAKALTLRAELRARAADLEGASVEELQAVLADVEEARDLLTEAPAEEQAAVFGLWLRILVLIGDPGELAVALPRAQSAAPGLGPDAEALLSWLEGHCSGTPEDSWRLARERSAALGDELGVARATLDLARLRLAAGRAGEASSLAAELASTLGARAASPEDLAALKALARAVAPGVELASEDLDRVERVLKTLEWDRRALRALDLAT